MAKCIHLQKSIIENKAGKKHMHVFHTASLYRTIGHCKILCLLEPDNSFSCIQHNRQKYYLLQIV